MVAARSVYETGSAVEVEAKDRSLDPAVLEGVDVPVQQPKSFRAA